MNYVSARRSRTARRELFTAASYAGLVAFTLSALAFGLFVQMAVYVAQGNRLHVGADILFAGFSSVQLLMLALYAGFAAMAGIIATAGFHIAARNI